MSPLDFVKPSIEDATLNVLLYGQAKSGKSMGAASAPGPILYMNADRPNATLMAHAKYGDKLHEVRVESLQTMIDVGHELNENAAKWGTVVLDPVGDVYTRVLDGMSGRAVRPDIRLRGDTSMQIERFCIALCEAPVNVVFVCHETAEKDEDAGGFERLPFTGTSNPKLGAKLMAMVDAIGYTGVVEGEGDEEPKYLAQLISGGGRRGGDRFGELGRVRDVNISEWVDLSRDVLAGKSEGKEKKS